MTVPQLTPSGPIVGFRASLVRLVAPCILALAILTTRTPSRAAPPATAPSWAEDQIVPLVRSASSKAVRLTIMNASISSHYGRLTALKGRQYLILATEWTNQIRLTQVGGKNVATAYMVPDLRDQAYLVADGMTVWQLATAVDGLPGVLPRVRFTVAVPGDVVKGNLVFDIPVGTVPSSLTFRFYDFAHGHMTLDLAGAIAAPAPLSPPQKNEVIEAGVFGMKKAEKLDAPAPAGMTWLLIDFRARSTVVTEADATAFDPAANPGDKTMVGTVADWKESRKYVQIVADGQYAYQPQPASMLPAEPRFLPDVFTGGSLAFLVPSDAKSLALHCDFPNALLRGQAEPTHPEAFEIPLEGTAPPAATAAPLAEFKDSVFEEFVTEQSTASTFAGTTADDRHKFLILTLVVHNLSPKGEFFQTKDQVKYVAESAAQSGLDPVSYLSPHRPWDLLWIPAGQSREFQMVYRIPVGDTRPRLACLSVDAGGGQIVKLPVIEGK